MGVTDEYKQSASPPMTRRGREVYLRYLPAIHVLIDAIGVLPEPARRRLIEFRYNSDSHISRLVRFAALKTTLPECGDLVDIHRQCDLLGLANLRLGSRISVHPKCYIDATGGVRIGNDVSIAHHATIMSTTHTFTDGTVTIRDQPVASAPTVIEDDVWIGAGSRILAGVTIGSHSIVAAGAVVTRDVPSGVIVGGVPARVLKQI